MYTHEITRRHRSAFILVIDRSASMQEMVRMGNRKMTKAQALTLISSSMITELIDRCRRTDALRNYYDIAVVGYGDDKVEMLLGDEGFVAIDRLANRPTSTLTLQYELQQDDQVKMVEQALPVWFEPKAEGNTPMYEALLRVKELVEEWCGREENRESFPPIVINISDGEMSDGCYEDMMDITSLIRRQATQDGNTLLINIHLEANSAHRSLIFPSEQEFMGATPAMRMMAEASSIMPEIFEAEIINLKGGGAKPPFMALGYNASILEVISIMNIGSRSGPALQ